MQQVLPLDVPLSYPNPLYGEASVSALLLAAHHTSHFTNCTSPFSEHPSQFTPRISHLTSHISHPTPHTSHLTPHTRLHRQFVLCRLRRLVFIVPGQLHHTLCFCNLMLRYQGGEFFKFYFDSRDLLPKPVQVRPPPASISMSQCTRANSVFCARAACHALQGGQRVYFLD